MRNVGASHIRVRGPIVPVSGTNCQTGRCLVGFFPCRAAAGAFRHSLAFEQWPSRSVCVTIGPACAHPHDNGRRLERSFARDPRRRKAAPAPGRDRARARRRLSCAPGAGGGARPQSSASARSAASRSTSAAASRTAARPNMGCSTACRRRPPASRTEDWVNRIHPEDRDATVKHFIDALAGTSEDYVAEYRIIRPSDGEF